MLFLCSFSITQQLCWCCGLLKHLEIAAIWIIDACSFNHEIIQINMQINMSETANSQIDFFLKKWILLFSKKALHLSKVIVKTLIMLLRFLFQINAVLLNFLFIKESWKKCISVSRDWKTGVMIAITGFMNPVRGLPSARHQRSPLHWLAHHTDC